MSSPQGEAAKVLLRLFKALLGEEAVWERVLALRASSGLSRGEHCSQSLWANELP
jgi:hypothetical protein